MSTRSSTPFISQVLKNQLQQRVYTATLRRVGPHLRYARAVSTAEKNLVLTGFVLGGCSILTAIFPICGLPMGIAGLLIGLRGRRQPALYTLATWGAALAVIGLALTLVCAIIGLSVYFGHRMWG
jgi:hypothetical protein